MRSTWPRAASISAVVVLLATAATRAGNPILPGLGVCDPDIRIYDGRAYLYASHDADAANKTWRMDDWWVWSSDDLVNWRQDSVLRPEQTYWGKPSDTCWATTAATRAGKYYFYFSRGRAETGVVVGDTPAGPWRDPIGKPLVSPASTPTKTAARDPAVLQDDDGKSYLAFGKFDFYLARLNDDMVSLAEAPRLITIDGKAGPYGEGKTDDKVFLHKRGGKYYLSWGCFYAMADNPYGPYAYKGSVIDDAHTADVFKGALLHDRHGSFFEFHRQWYFACNERSSPGATAYFRNTAISYVHYRANGEIAPIDLSPIGVGEYDAKQEVIQAENFFRADVAAPQSGVATSGARPPAEVVETPDGFAVARFAHGNVLAFPNVADVPENATMHVRASSARGATIEVHAGSADGPTLGRCVVPGTGEADASQTVACDLTNAAGPLDLYLVAPGDAELQLDWFSLKPRRP